MQKQKLQSILFRVTENALIVANTGKAFTREGIISLCHLHSSEKQKAIKDNYGCDLNLIEEIADRHLSIYEKDINMLGEHVRNEDAISIDYHDRLLLELLQNANDAVDEQRPTLIGAKGIGFKSVLQISREPSIYSGDFSFCFSKDKTRERIKEIVQISDNENVPVFRIPHKCQPDEEIAELKQEYETSIRLPFKDTEVREQTIKQLQELSAECLLFCPHLNCIKVEIQEGAQKIEREIRLKRRDVFGAKKSKVELTTTENGRKESKSWQQWMRIKKGISASIALPLDKGKAVPCTEKPLHVFFPSDEKLSKIGALIHASFEIQSNRQHLDKQQKNAIDICGMIKEMTKDILRHVPPKTGLLAFGKAHEDEYESVIGTVRQSIAEAVAETAFVPILGGGKCKPNEIKLWENNFGDLLKSNRPEVRGERLLCGLLQKDEEVFSILMGLEAGEIIDEDYFRLLQYCKNGSVEDCCNAIKFAVDKFSDDVVINEHLRKIPFWLLGTNRARSYDGDCPILMKCLLPWPEWLRVDVLSPGFKKAFEGINDRRKLPCVPLEKEDFIEKVLVPHCDGKDQKWWRENGTKILHQASEWLEDNSVDDLIIGEEDERNTVGRVIRVPTKKGWIPAIECYAGSKWGGYKQFDGMEKVILPIEKWKIEDAKKEEYIPLLQWLGVSRIPKLYVVEGNYERDISTLEPKYKDSIIQDIRERGHNGHSLNDKRQFYFDESAIMKIRSIRSEDFAEILVRLHRKAKQNRYSYSYVYKYTYTSGSIALALYQLKHLEWIRCKPGIMGGEYKKPWEIYARGKSLGGLLPEVIEIKDERLRYEFLDVMKELGMKEALPEEKSEVIDLIKKLYENRQTKDEAKTMRWDGTRGAMAIATKAVYSHYIKNFGAIPDALKIPCIRKTDKGEFMYFADSDYYWLDNPYLDIPVVRSKLLEKEDINIFICSLTDGEKSDLPSLYDYLDSNPECKDEVSHETEEMQKRYNDRRRYLNAINDDSFSEDVKIHVYESIYLKSEQLPDVDIYVPYKTNEDDLSTINVSMKDSTIRALAAALASLSKNSAYKSDFEIFLSEENNDGCLRRLREDYGKTEESLSDIEAKQKEEQEQGEVGEGQEQGEVGEGQEEGEVGEGQEEGKVEEGQEQGKVEEGQEEGKVEEGQEQGKVEEGQEQGKVEEGQEQGKVEEGQEQGKVDEVSTEDNSKGKGKSGGWGGGGEGKQHKELRECISKNPKKYGLNIIGDGHKESLPSGDEIDVVFETDDEYVIVEVKSEISDDNDIKRGLYQCVKYRAVVSAMLSVENRKKKIRAVLAVARDWGDELEELRKQLGKVSGEIEIIRVPRK